ncbi:hypothetical protein [Micromonospora sp. NPDC004551]|uniref:hypothetical protein n=1 Tax=Micromonospora sp. NPDC004551 TaxID=3154284 RepID=UPI0033A7AFC8
MTDWLQGFSALLAVVLAAPALIVAVVTYRDQQEINRAQLESTRIERQRYEQRFASRVAVWSPGVLAVRVPGLLVLLRPVGCAASPYPQSVLPTYASLAVWLTRAELGDVATWIGSTANVATCGLALAAAVVGFRVYKIESGRDQRAEDERRERAADARRSQAELVSVWWGQATKTVYSDWGGKLGPREVNVWAAHVLNASNLPVYQVVVAFQTRWTRRSSLEHLRVVPPHQAPLTIELPEAMKSWPEVSSGASDNINVKLSFRDSAGRRWVREEDGFLREVPVRPRRSRPARAGKGPAVAKPAGPSPANSGSEGRPPHERLVEQLPSHDVDRAEVDGR